MSKRRDDVPSESKRRWMLTSGVSFADRSEYAPHPVGSGLASGQKKRQHSDIVSEILTWRPGKEGVPSSEKQTGMRSNQRGQKSYSLEPAQRGKQ